MNAQHKGLVRSSILAATATVTLLANSGNAQVTLYTTEADFLADMTAGGLTHVFTEDFEDHDEVSNPYGYALLSNPLDATPNGVFGNGITEGLMVSPNDGQNLFLAVPGPYNGAITSSVVGTPSFLSALRLDFDGGTNAVAFDLWGIDTFISSPPDTLEFTLFDADGGIIGSGAVAVPDTGTTGDFFGASSTTAIHAMEIRGTRFEQDQPEYIDNVQSWTVSTGGTPGDVNDDGSVDVTDLLQLLAAWGICDGCPEDIDGDGLVNVNDLLVLLANWG